MRIPSTAPRDVQLAFADIWRTLDVLTRPQNVDLNGRRFLNAGDAIDPSEFVTLRQIKAASRTSTLDDASTVTTLTVKGVATFNGAVYVRGLEDAGVVFAKAGGLLATDAANISYKYSNGTLLLSATGRYRLHHGIYLASSASGIANLVGEDTDPIVRLTLGPDTSSYPCLVPNGTNLELRKAGGGGALVDLTVATLNATTLNANVVATTVTATHIIGTTDVVAGTDPGGASTLRVGGDVRISGKAFLGTDPGGTDHLRVGGALTISDTKLLTSKTTFTDGAAAAAGTLLNAPAAGNPTKWVAVNDNGTTRYLPLW